MKPVILITASIADDEKLLRVSRAYTEAVERAGGIALIPDGANIDNIQRLMEVCDGVLLSGGGDIDPYFFDEQPIKELGEISPMRDAFEIELAIAAERLNKPILAICRGAQVLNVAFGGKVYQDIYAQIKTPLIKHSQEMPRSCASHSVNLYSGSLIRGLLTDSDIRVNSFHHQAVSALGKHMRITAAAADGVIEAIEHTEMEFCLGVQWHPEAMLYKYPAQFKIFKEFIRRAQNSIKERV